MDELEALKISDLQELLRSRGLSTSYRLKADLVNRLRQNVRGSTSGGQNEENNDDNDEVFNESTKDDGQNSNHDGK